VVSVALYFKKGNRSGADAMDLDPILCRNLAIAEPLGGTVNDLGSGLKVRSKATGTEKFIEKDCFV